MKQMLLYLLLFVSLGLSAQETKESQTVPQSETARPQLRKFVVADLETHVPVRGAIVSTKSGYRDTTNYRGICYIPTKFDTLSVSNPKYLTERLVMGEARDSTFLIPSRQIFRENTPSAGFGFDFAKILDGRYRRDMKHLRKTKEIFKEMDKDDEDPIVKAYKQAMAEKKKESEGKTENK